MQCASLCVEERGFSGGVGVGEGSAAEEQTTIHIVMDPVQGLALEMPEACPVNMLDLVHIRAGLAGKHWPEAGRMIPAHWLSSGPDPFGRNLAQSARTKSDPGWFCIILSGTSVE